MHFTTVLAATAAAFASFASAGPAAVVNRCSFPVYLRSVNNQNGAVGPLVTLAAGTGTYSEAFRSPSGSAIKVGTQTALSAPLTFEYTPSGNGVYYDVSNNAGNPFANQHVTLVPSVNTCYTFNCQPNDPNCYSNGSSIKTKFCTNTASLTLTVCA